MKKITDVLRLKFEVGLSHEKIARALGLSKGAVAKYASLAEAQGLSWPLPLEMDEAALVLLHFIFAGYRCFNLILASSVVNRH